MTHRYPMANANIDTKAFTAARYLADQFAANVPALSRTSAETDCHQ